MCALVILYAHLTCEGTMHPGPGAHATRGEKGDDVKIWLAYFPWASPSADSLHIRRTSLGIAWPWLVPADPSV